MIHLKYLLGFRRYRNGKSHGGREAFDNADSDDIYFGENGGLRSEYDGFVANPIARRHSGFILVEG